MSQPPEPRAAQRRAWPYLASIGFVAFAGLVAWGVSQSAVVPHVSVVCLCAVLASAVRWGRGPGLFAAALSVGLSSFFFYPPIYSFEVASRQDLVDLAIFSMAALLASTLADEVRRQRIVAERHDSMTAELYAFSRRLAGIADVEALPQAIAEAVASAVGRAIVLVLPEDGRLIAAGGAGVDPAAEAALRAAGAGRGGDTVPDPNGWHLRWLRRGEKRVALLAVADPALEARGPELLEAMADQAAVALERAQLATAIEDARVRVKTEELREALLNSVSHDLQTPLAAIIGSATALQSFEGIEHREAEAELVATIREEGERLHHVIGNVLDLTRIRAGEIRPRLEIVELADIVNAALRRVERVLAAHVVEVDLADDLPMVRLDLFLTEQALVNLLENAAKYSPPGSLIRVTATPIDAELVVVVRDHGVGIASEERAKIFGQFYRAEAREPRPSGSGLGLAICRAFIEAQDGRVEATSDGPGTGAAFRIRLPLADDGAREAEWTDE